MAGAGPIGRAAVVYLAAGGVERIGVVGADSEQLAGAALGVLVESYPVELDDRNAEAIAEGHDVVVACERACAAANAACCALRLPLVAGGLDGRGGWALSARPGQSACWRCAFPADPDGADQPAAVAGVIGSLQALEALKLLSGEGEPLLDRLLRLDASRSEWTPEPVRRRPDCPACATIPG